MLRLQRPEGAAMQPARHSSILKLPSVESETLSLTPPPKKTEPNVHKTICVERTETPGQGLPQAHAGPLRDALWKHENLRTA